MKYGLIGEHLGHSFSKDIHNKIGDYGYELKEIAKTDIEDFMLRKEFAGINVTIPYKQTVIEYLDEITKEANLIGAVNTVVNKGGKLYGHNTDFGGLKALIKFKNIEIKGRKVLICGTGGTSKTAYAVCKELGAECIIKLSRSRNEGSITYDEAKKNHRDAQVIINTTPCGMYPDIDSAALDIEDFDKLEAVIDVVYNPLRTDLIQKAQALGLKSAGGLYMLVMQAVLASEFFFDNKVDEDVAFCIYNELVRNKKNIVLIGMPASGKTTLGKMLSEKLNRRFYDADEYLVEKYGRQITEIFENDGEKVFRNMESEVLKQLCTQSGVVIATGGGAVLNPENMRYLAKNGYICFIDRPLENLAPTSDRPTASDYEAIKKRYEERYDLYLKYKDIRIDASASVDEITKEITEAFLNENFSD